MNKLYMVFNTDMDSMTRGRVAAMAAHGQSLVHYRYENSDYLFKWQGDHAFGTVIILKPREGVSYYDLRAAFTMFLMTTEYMWFDDHGLIIDPEYMLKDGKEIHSIANVEAGFWYLPEEKHNIHELLWKDKQGNSLVELY